MMLGCLCVIPYHIPGGHHLLPIDDFFTFSPYEVLFLRGQDAQRVLLTRPRLSIDDIRALVHIDCALGQGAGLWGATEMHREKC